MAIHKGRYKWNPYFLMIASSLCSSSWAANSRRSLSMKDWGQSNTEKGYVRRNIRR